jgi:hypothetical protein
MPKRQHPGGENGNQATPASSTQPVYANGGDGGDKKIEHTINLDSHELFSQFCAIANLVKVGPRRGVFLSVVNVEEKVMRVWREWLDERAKEYTQLKNRETRGRQNEDEAVLGCIADDKAILWTDHRRNVGLRVIIKERKWQSRDTGPILVEADEEQPVSYSVEINGMRPYLTLLPDWEGARDGKLH